MFIRASEWDLNKWLWSGRLKIVSRGETCIPQALVEKLAAGMTSEILTGRIVSDAIMVAALRGDSARKDLRLAYFLGSANEISVGEAGRLEPEHD